MLSIVSRGDWLWKSASFKEGDKRAVADVESTCHVTTTVHKPKQTFKDSGWWRQSFFVWRWFWGDFRHPWWRWGATGTIFNCCQWSKCKICKNLHVLSLFEGICGATRDCTVTRTNNSKQRISRRFQMIIPKLYSRKFIKLYLVYLAEVP